MWKFYESCSFITGMNLIYHLFFSKTIIWGSDSMEEHNIKIEKNIKLIKTTILF